MQQYFIEHENDFPPDVHDCLVAVSDNFEEKKQMTSDTFEKVMRAVSVIFETVKRQIQVAGKGDVADVSLACIVPFGGTPRIPRQNTGGGMGLPDIARRRVEPLAHADHDCLGKLGQFLAVRDPQARDVVSFALQHNLELLITRTNSKARELKVGQLFCSGKGLPSLASDPGLTVPVAMAVWLLDRDHTGDILGRDAPCPAGMGRHRQEPSGARAIPWRTAAAVPGHHGTNHGSIGLGKARWSGLSGGGCH